MINWRECRCVSVSGMLPSECYWIEGCKNADGIGITISISVSITEWNNVHVSWQHMSWLASMAQGILFQVDTTASSTLRRGNFVKKKTQRFIKWLYQSLAHHSAPYFLKVRVGKTSSGEYESDPKLLRETQIRFEPNWFRSAVDTN